MMVENLLSQKYTITTTDSDKESKQLGSNTKYNDCADRGPKHFSRIHKS